MGASSSASRTEFQPNSDEIGKAVVLSSLAYLDNAKRKEAIQNRYSHIGLESIVMAPDFIVAQCNQNNSTTLFVAFSWRFRIQDMFALKVAGKDEFNRSYVHEAAKGKDVRGLFHYELFHRITRNLPSMSYFQNYKADEIIFSGHSLAGALAHLFLICYMLNTAEEAKRHISIGFGSPYFCDSDAKQFCEKIMELDKRMFTLVNGADPVPRLLMGVRMTVACNPECIERTVAEKLSSCLDRLNSWLNPANSEEMIEIVPDNLLWVKVILMVIKSIDRSGSPCYVDVGAYYEGRELKSVNPVTDTDINAWHCHRVECYIQEFIVNMNGEGFLKRPVITEESSLRIDACNLNIYHGPKSHEAVIVIKGLALSELKEYRVKPKVGRQWKVECSNDSSILLSGVLSKMEAATINSWKNEDKTDQTHDLSVYIRTCFGSTVKKKVMVENPWRDSSVAYALNRALGRLLLMQRSIVLRGSGKYSQAYGALQCVFRPQFVLSEETKRKHCDTVKLLLTDPVETAVETPIPNDILQKMKNASSFAQFAGPGLPWKLYSVISSHSCISMFPNQNTSSSNNESSSNGNKRSYVYCICDNKLRKLNYLDILRTIYCLLTGTESKYGQSVDASYYEKEIYKHVHIHGPAVKSRQGLPEGLVTDIEGRAWKIYKIIWACNLLQDFRMAAFIGPENAGKTTLINSILGENVGDVGFTTHTSAATPYRFTNDIFIIDFHGTDAGGERAHLSKVWEVYEKVADICIVVLNFGGDTSGAAEQFLRIARSRMCKNVVLVMNRMDSVLNGSRISPVWSEYSPTKVEQLRMSFAESCGLSNERVFLSVSKSSEEVEETTCELLEERPTIMMKEEITTNLRRLLRGTKVTTF